MNGSSDAPEPSFTRASASPASVSTFADRRPDSSIKRGGVVRKAVDGRESGGGRRRTEKGVEAGDKSRLTGRSRSPLREGGDKGVVDLCVDRARQRRREGLQDLHVADDGRAVGGLAPAEIVFKSVFEAGLVGRPLDGPAPEEPAKVLGVEKDGVGEMAVTGGDALSSCRVRL